MGAVVACLTEAPAKRLNRLPVSHGMGDEVIISREGNIGRVTVNRPKQLNAMNSAVRSTIAAAFEQFGGDSEVRAIILAGAGEKSFIAGADLAEFAASGELDSAKMRNEWHMTEVAAACPTPIIAMVDGFCLGGGMELAMACDLRVASDRSRFGQPEINLGILPGAGGTQRLPRLAGEGRALELMLTGRMIDAAEAERYGIVNFVWPADVLEELTLELAEQIASKAAFAAERVKRATRSGLALEEGLQHERELFAECFNSPDGKEGVAAFLEKRKPRFNRS